MESKISEKMMREVYFKAFGKEYDSLDRKQTPLPLEIAYKVALNKLKRDKKYEFGGEITEDIYYKSVNDFVFFCLNYPSNFLNIFGGFEKHFANKFKAYYNGYGSYGAMIKLYIELDSDNRRLLTDFAYENYDSSFSKSNISEVEYYNSVNHFVFFCFNFPNNFMEAFPIHLRVHLSEKWSDAYRKKGSIGAMIYFWSLLSDDNRKKLADWVRVNYTGTRLYELGGALGDVAGMLPSPLPMSTIQAMEKGGRVGYYNNLRDLLELRDNGTKTIVLNGFRENIGYVIDLKLDDKDLIKIEDGVYETTYKKGGQIELFADGGELKYLKYKNEGAYADVSKVSKDEWYLLMIEAEIEGQGYAKKIMNQIIQDAIKQNVKKITLDTSLYNKDYFEYGFGFQETGYDESNDLFQMELKLENGGDIQYKSGGGVDDVKDFIVYTYNTKEDVISDNKEVEREEKTTEKEVVKLYKERIRSGYDYAVIIFEKGSFKEIYESNYRKTLEKYDNEQENYANGGGVKSDYYIFEGVDNLNGNPLYRVESSSESDIEYIGEWNTNRNDAQNELDELLNKSKKTLGVVKVIFENPAYNYSTNVGVDVTEEEARNYFVGKMFDVGAFPKENMQKAIDIEFSKSKDNYADGGEIVDLFEDYENIPANVQEVFDRYSEKFGDDLGGMNYQDMANMQKEVEKLGYTFDSYLDNVPFGLRPVGVELNQLRGYEEYGLGGFLFGAGVGALGYKLYLDSKTKKGKEKIKKTYTKIKKKVGLD